MNNEATRLDPKLYILFKLRRWRYDLETGGDLLSVQTKIDQELTEAGLNPSDFWDQLQTESSGSQPIPAS
jgi:hypothetical protein